MVNYKLQARKKNGKWITVGTAKRLNASSLKKPAAKKGWSYRIIFK